MHEPIKIDRLLLILLALFSRDLCLIRALEMKPNSIQRVPGHSAQVKYV